MSNDGVKLGDAFRGAVLVAKGQAVLLETYGGLADARDGTTSTAATRFQLASVSKQVDHVTVFRWVQRFTPLFADAAGTCRHALGDRWFVDETYVKVAGRWRYVYRAVDQYGQIIDVYVSNRRDTRTARRFFTAALRAHGEPA